MNERTAKKIRMSRYRAAREANGGTVKEYGIIGGHLLVPCAEFIPALRRLHRKMTWIEMARLAGVSDCTFKDIAIGRRHRIHMQTARRVESFLADYDDPVARSTTVRLPGEPLAELVRVRYGSLQASGYNDQIHRLCREGLSADQAERWAMRLLGKLPEEIWPDYWSAA